MEEAKTLVRTTVRTFKPSEKKDDKQAAEIQALLVDALLHHTVLHLDDFNALTQMPQKELRGYLQPLRTNRLIHTGSRREHHVASQRDATREYYYVQHSDAVNCIKYRVNKLRTEISNQYLTKSGPDAFLCPQCKSTWKELEIVPGADGSLPCPRCDFRDVILNEAAFKNQGMHENINKLNSQLSQFNTLFAAFDAKLTAGQFRDLKFDEQFPRRKIVPKEAGGKSWQWVEVRRPRDRETAAGAVNETDLDLNITSAARQAAEEAERERERKEKIAHANARPEWINAGVAKGATLDIRGDDAEPASTASSGLVPKKEEEEDDKKPDILKDTKGQNLSERERAEQALMEQYMQDMQREQEEVERRKREEEEEDGEEEEEDEDDEFEDVPGTGTGAVGTPMSSSQGGADVKPAVPAVNGIKREYEDDSSEAATPASASDERDSKRLKIENGADVKMEGSDSTSVSANGTPMANSAPAAVSGGAHGNGNGDREESEDEEFEDV